MELLGAEGEQRDEAEKVGALRAIENHQRFKRKKKKSLAVNYLCAYLIEDTNCVYLIISPVTRTMLGMH